MWIDVVKGLDKKMRDYIARRNIRYGVFLIFSGALWALQIEGYLDFQLLMPSLLVLAGVLMLAEGTAISRMSIKRAKRKRR